MTEAKRALPPPRRRGIRIFLALALILLVAATLLVLNQRRAEIGGSPAPPVPSPSASPAGTTSAPTMSTPTMASPDPRPKTAEAEDKAAAALKGCRAKVSAADQAMAAGKEGMRHWAEHVQAQTDANTGKISVRRMERIFERTMKAGAKDERRYSAAVKAYDRENGSCRAVGGAPAKVVERLARCADRERAQHPVLAAAEDGMGDWTKHLADMRRSKQGKIHHPQQRWLRTWRAAPTNIKAYDKAADRFSAPKC